MTLLLPADTDAKLTGRTRFVADLAVPGALHARPVLSPFAAARITGIDAAAALGMPGVVAVLTAADLPGAGGKPADRASAMLAGERVVFQGQPVALVVAETAAAAADAVAGVDIDYEPGEAVTDPEAALADGAPLVWPEGAAGGSRADADAHAGGAGGGGRSGVGNMVTGVHHVRGNVQQGFAEADVVVRATYRTDMVHQGYLEPQACAAALDPVDGKLTVWSSSQGPFSVRDSVARVLGRSINDVRVVPMPVGGGFGAKYGTFEPLAAAAAVTLGRPVQIVLDRSADFAATTPAPACIFHVTTGATADGRLTALQARVVVDAGAFRTSLIGLACNLLGGSYRFPHLLIVGAEVLTNKPATGAYRAPGAPQAAFAIESQIDEMALRLDLDPLEFRLANAARTGDPLPDGDEWPSLGLVPVLERAAEHPLWKERGALGEHEAVGLAVGGWPGGLAPAAAACRADSDGTIYLDVGSVDLTGTSTALRLIAAETIGVSPEQVVVTSGDTERAPYSGPAGGSMITYTVGVAVAAAAAEAREQILAVAAEMLEAAPGDLDIADGVVSVRGAPGSELPLPKLLAATRRFGAKYAPIMGHGRSAQTTQAPGFTAQLAHVRVDPDTGEVRVLRNAVIQDVGKAINPPLVEGQIHGGAAQGIGWALQERLDYDAAGQLRSGSFLDYALPKADQVPPIEPVLVENPSPHGPLGARGVGEPPIIAGPAAVANAIRAATGARLTELPMTPERVWRALGGPGGPED